MPLSGLPGWKSKDEPVSGALLEILSDAGISVLIATSQNDEIIEVNNSICLVLNREASDLIGNTAADALRDLIDPGAEVQTRHLENNGILLSVYTYRGGNNKSDDMDDLYCKISKDGIIVNVTPSILSISGYTRDEVLGKSIFNYFADTRQRDELLYKLGQDGGIKDFIFDMLRKDGEIFTASGSLHVVLDQAGLPSSYEGILSNISDDTRLEKEILKQSLYFREVVESVPDAVITVDNQGKVTSWNKEAVELFDWTVNEALGQQLDVLVGTETGNDEISSEAVINGQVIRGLECTRHGKLTQEKKVFVSVAPIVINGENQGAVGVYTDLSHRDSILGLLRENEIKFRAITESAQDAVIIMDSQGFITFFNTSAEQMFGYQRSEAIGEKLHHLIAPEQYWEMIEMGFSHFKETGKGIMVGRVVEMEGRRKNGTTFPVELSVSSFFLNEGWCATGILRDISERKMIELELIEAREEALNATRTKSEFLANMSHEIRTPLNAIIGTNDLLMGTDLNPVQKSYLRVGRNASDNLLSLVNDILDISKVEAGRIELENIPFDLYEEVEKTCETLALRAHEKGIDLNCGIHPETPVWVQGDPSRIKQVLANLIGNAIKFTDKGEISVSVKPHDPGRVSFAISDTGIGIPEGKVEAIFMSFTQADSSHTRRYGGTGLGLAICTKFVELMGGKISVKSEIGSGSEFSFFIDLPETPSCDQPDHIDFPDISDRRILVVDHNQRTRENLKVLLESWGASVELVESGIHALEKVVETEYDLVLLDLKMSDMDGLEIAANMQKGSGSTSNVIMMLTCSDSNLQIEKCRISGVEHYIFKPVRRYSLSKNIQGILNGVAPDLSREQPSIQSDSSYSIEKMQLSILLAEDSPDNRFLILNYTKKYPWDITIAENGQEAFDYFLQKKFDLILMDMQMPVMDGYEATRSIRAHESVSMSEHVPIVALTAHALREEVKKCLDAGCDIHISKPVRKLDLLRQLDELIKIMGPREGLPELADHPLGILIQNHDHDQDQDNDKEQENISAESQADTGSGPIALVPEDLEPLIPGYLRNRRGDVIRIRKLVQDSGYSEAQRLAHSMKGSGGGYGFDKITQLGTAMEIAAKSQESAAILSGIDELEKYLNTVRIEYVDED